MPHVNVACMRGIVQNAPTLSYTPNGKPVCRFLLAVTTWFKVVTTVRSLTIRVPCIVFGKLADGCYAKLQQGWDTEVWGHLQPGRDEFAGQWELCGERVLYCGKRLEEVEGPSECPHES